MSPQTATAVDDWQNQKVKMVVQFEIDKNPNAVRGDYNLCCGFELANNFDALGTNLFNVTTTGSPSERNPYNYDADLKLANIHEHGTNPTGDFIYQLNPQPRLSFDENPNITEAELNTELNTLMAVWRMSVVDMLQTEGAYNVETYIHFTYGSMKLDEGF